MENDAKFKRMTLRITHENWVFLKLLDIKEEKSMNAILNEMIDKYREKTQKKLDK